MVSWAAVQVQFLSNELNLSWLLSSMPWAELELNFLNFIQLCFFIWDVFFVRTKCTSNQTFPPSTVRSKMSFSIFDDWSPFTNCWFIGFPPQWYKRFLFNVHYRPVGCSEQCRHRGSVVSRSLRKILVQTLLSFELNRLVPNSYTSSYFWKWLLTVVLGKITLWKSSMASWSVQGAKFYENIFCT